MRSQSIKKAIQLWLHKFKWPELVTVFGMAMLGILYKDLEAKNITLVAVGELGEYFLFLGTLLLQETIRARGSFREVFKDILAISPAEVLDAVLRPLVLYTLTCITSNTVIVLVVGKFAADVLFYSSYYFFRLIVSAVATAYPGFLAVTLRCSMFR